MPFVKGQSGNPDGRPKKFKIRDYLSDDEIDGLIKLVKEKAESGDKDMIKLLVEQIFGKPSQSIDHTTLGQSITPIYANKSIQGHTGNTEDIQPDQEDKSSGGGNIGEQDN